MVAPCTSRKEDKSSNDLFITPIEALNAIKPYLMKDLVDHRVTDVLDPCSGLGDISHWLSQNTTCNIIANELYPCPDRSKLVFQPHYEQDLLDDNNTIPIADVILANAPYNKAVEFVLKGFDREETANSVCYAWYRFDKYYCGQPRLHWLTK